MQPDSFYEHIVLPVSAWMPAVKVPDSREARVMLMAIAGQESNWRARLQKSGPARSYWQFERGGGVAQVFQRCGPQLDLVCNEIDVPFDADKVFEAMAWHDMLACTMARFLLWTDYRQLPKVGDEQGSWDYYLRNWGPGMPRPNDWGAVYARSVSIVGG